MTEIEEGAAMTTKWATWLLVSLLVVPLSDGRDRRGTAATPDEEVECALTVDALAAAMDAGAPVSIETSRGPLSLRVHPSDVRAPGFRAEASARGGAPRALEIERLVLASGTVDGDPSSFARLAVTDDGVRGLIVAFDRRYTITGRDAGLGEQLETATPRSLDGEAMFVLTIATDADAEYVSAAGSAEAAAREILGIVHITAGLFEQELGVTLRIGYLHLWEGSDPYEETLAGWRIREFVDVWERGFHHVPRDLAHLFVGHLDDGMLGAAWPGVVCRRPIECYSVSLRWLSGAIFAHEIAHNLGALTPYGEAEETCRGSLMASPLTGQLTFCEPSRAQIRAYLAEHGQCLGRVPRACAASVAPERWRGEFYTSTDPRASPEAVADLGDELSADLDAPPGCMQEGADAARFTRFVHTDESRTRLTIEGRGSAEVRLNGATIFSGELEDAPVELLVTTGHTMSLLESRLTRSGAGRIRLSLWSLAPAPPAAVTRRVKGHKVIVSWSDMSDDEEGFVVERLDPRLGWVEAARTGPDTTKARLRDQVRPAHASYAVRSFGSQGISCRALASPAPR